MNKSFGKVMLVVLLVFSSLMLTSCDKSEPKSGSLTEITATQCYDKMVAKDTFILFVGQLSCPHCEDYIEILNKYMEDHALHVYLVEADREENREDGSMDKLLIDYFPTLEYTPTTYYIVDGVVVDEVVNVMNSSQISEWLKRNNIKLEK